ncbi:MAG: O-antigen ligase family protein [Tepidisphaerales bacterium]
MTLRDDWPDESERRPLLGAHALTRLALLLALSVVVARATMLELVRDPFEVSPGQAYTPLGPGPGATLVLNALCVLSAVLVLLRRAIDPSYRLASVWASGLWVALGVLATASAAWTNDRYVTVLTSSTLLASGALAWTFSQTVRSWGRLRLVLAVAVGLLAVYAVQGIYYRYAELPLLQEQVERSKEQILRERGFQPDTFAAEQFLRRISGGEMIGFGSSPNTYAAALVMLAVTAGGVLAQGLVQRKDPVLLAAPAIAILMAAWMLPYTRSTTALVTPLLGAGLVAATWLGRDWLGRDWLARHRTALFWAGVAAVVAGIAAVVAHGMYHGGLPGASLNFRWRYWLGAWALWREHGAWGVGYGNFGAWYLAYRLPAAAEEIRDPHNLLVRFATELGWAGLVLSVLWLLRSAWELTRAPRGDGGGRSSAGPWALTAVVAAATALSVPLTIDLSADAAWVVLELFKRLMFMGVLLVVGGLSVLSSRTSARGDTSPAELARVAVVAALGVFLLHNMIDFSLFEPGPMAMAAMLWGAACGSRAEREETGEVPAGAADGHTGGGAVRWASAAAAAGLLAALGVWAAFVAVPVVRGDRLAREADELLRTSALDAPPRSRSLTPATPGGTGLRGGPVRDGLASERVQLAAMRYADAFRVVPWNAEYAMKSARAWLVGRMSLVNIREMLDAAIAADPRHVRYRLDRARLELLLAGDEADLDRALTELETATRLNPTDVPIRLEYAEALLRAGRVGEAVGQWRLALSYDDRLDPTEPKRMTAQQRASVERRIAEAEAAALPQSR